MPDQSPKFYTRAVSLDVLKAQQDPNPKVADFLVELLKDEEYAEYFFKDLSNSAWFVPLKERGFFEHPPQSRRWQAILYLERMATSCSAEVAEILISIPPINAMVLWDAIAVLLKLKPEDTAKVVPTIDKWLECEYLGSTNFSPEIGKLFAHLVAGNCIDGALSLLDILTRPEKGEEGFSGRTEPTSRMEPFWFGEMLEHRLGLLSEKAPLQVCSILKKNLNEGLEIEYGEDPDYSYIWRPSIENDDHNRRRENYTEAMVSCLRDALKLAVKQAETFGQENEIKAFIDILLSRSPSLFQRIALHIITLHPDVFQDQIKYVACNKDFVGNQLIKPEFLYLTNQVYSTLSENDKSKWWKLVEEYSLSYEDDDKDLQTERRNYFKFECLFAVKDYLDADMKKLYDSLAVKFEEPTDLFHPIRFRTWSGVTSPAPVEHLSEMKPIDVISYLKTFKQTEPDIGPGVPTVEGLAIAFEKVVELRYRDYIDVAKELTSPDIKPTYISRFFQALESVCKSRKSLEWKPVLSLCNTLLSYSWPTPKSASDEEDCYDPLYSFRKDIARLLGEGLKPGEHSIPIEYKKEVLGVIEVILSNPDESEIGEQEFSGTNFSSFELSLNRPQGCCIHALMGAALWIYRHQYSPKDAVKLDPKVQQLLESNLDKQKVPSFAVHSVFGACFPNLYSLHRDWAISQVPKIFPKEREFANYWKTAFGTYLRYGRFDNETYKLLREEYRRAINAYDQGGIAGESLAEHIVVAYVRKLEDINSKDNLVTAFFTTTSDHIRADAMADIWRFGGKEKLFEDAELWARFRKLWEFRIEFKKFHPEQEVGQEFNRIMHWCDHIQEDVKTLYPLLDFSIEHAEFGWDIKHIAGYLLKFPVKCPKEIIALLHKLQTCNGVEKVAFLHETGIIRSILQTVKSSGDQEDKEIVYDIVNRFGEWGNHNYQDLV